MNTAQNPPVGIWKLLSSSTFQAALGVLIVLAVCWLAFYVMARLRDSNKQDVPLDALLRKNFEEMRSGGAISETEFRNITSLLEENPRRNSSSIENPASDSNVTPSDEKNT
jgi:hypothetical protein